MAHTLIDALALVDPLAVDVDGLGERIGHGGVALLADVARRRGHLVLEVDVALHGGSVAAERAAEGRLQLLHLLPRRRLRARRLPLPHGFYLSR